MCIAGQRQAPGKPGPASPKGAPEIVSNDLNHSVAGTGRSTTYQVSLPPARASSRIQAGSIPRRATHSHHLWRSPSWAAPPEP